MKLELVPIGVSDVDRAKAWYSDKAGFKLEVDVQPMPGMRVGELMDTQGVKYAGFSDPDGNGWLLQEWPQSYRR